MVDLVKAEKLAAAVPALRPPMLALALGCLGAAFVIAAHYPLAPGLLAAGLVLYGAALWRWPWLWLIAVPAALPAFDLAPWTGWFAVDESDLVILISIGVLALTAPPARADWRLGRWAQAALALAALATALGAARGLLLPGPPGGSDNPYLRPDQALVVAKGFAAAAALLPFLMRALAERRDARLLFAAGMTLGLALVAAATVLERAVFTGIDDFTTHYRVVGPFSSMHLGGGYIGGYLAMALPFVAALPFGRRIAGLLATGAAAAGGFYSLAVTYARSAYGGAVVAALVLCAGRAAAARRGGRKAALAAPALLLAALLAMVTAAAFDSRFMASRVVQVEPDLDSRATDWAGGLALADPGPLAAFLGMGLGSYPRTVLAHQPRGRYPTNFKLGEERGYRYLRLQVGLPLYIGQKVALGAGTPYHVSLALRSLDGKGALSILLCEKMMLYSTHCRGAVARPRAPGLWQNIDLVLPNPEIGSYRPYGLRRPVEFALYDPYAGTAIEVGAVHLTDAAGRELLANGDFAHGLEHWFFTDDDHRVWRIENQYLMTWFEGGALGLAALVLLAAVALWRLTRAALAGDTLAPVFAASLAAFLANAVFNCLLDVPRLATLFYLVASVGLAAPPPGKSKGPAAAG